MHFHVSSLSNKIAFLQLFIFIELAIVFIAELFFFSALMSLINIVSILNFLFLFYIFYNGKYLGPEQLMIISVIIFILARPILSFIFGYDTVQVGYKSYDLYSILVTIAFVLIVFNIICISRLLSGGKVEKFYSFVPTIDFYNRFISSVTFTLGLCFSVLFLYKSYQGMNTILSGVDYFEFTESNSYEHLKFFFLAKFLFFLSFLFSKDRFDVVKLCMLCFFSSIGFMMIGLRGYTIAYLFLFLSVLNLKYKIAILPLFLIAIVLLFTSSLVLNFRLGFSVTESFVDMIFMPFYQQGATFEVVFGAVNFKNEITSCLSIYDYFFSNQSFGNCVDKSRGVFFTEGGGFASSYFAELFFLGGFFTVFTSILFGIVLSILCSAYDRLSAGLYSDKASATIVFFLIPNLVYFARSSAFDFISKIVEIIFLLLCLVFIDLIGKKIGKT